MGCDSERVYMCADSSVSIRIFSRHLLYSSPSTFHNLVILHAMSGLVRNCIPETFSGLSLTGSHITSVLTNVVQNATFQFDQALRFDQPEIPTSYFDYCNVTIAYSHSEENDTIIIETLLPVQDFNERLIAVGGAGFVAGRGLLQQWQMLANIAEGYATVTTDAGLGTATSADSWALLSPGHVDIPKLQNLASVSLNDMVKIHEDDVFAEQC